MQHEKRASAYSRMYKTGKYWQGSLLLLILPALHSDRKMVAITPKNLELTPSAVALPHAHAHNDYRHDRPLAEALSRGFVSVEADVHLVGGELYLGHWFPQISAERTLRKVYLEPLNALMTRQNGQVYPGDDGIFYLMIDVKTDSLATYRVLRQQLLEYPAFQCNPNFRVFISGNRAAFAITNDSEQIAGVDGRLDDLDKPVGCSAMPVVSDNFRRHFKWRGKGSMPELELKKLRFIAEAVHRQGKKLRFWSIPDEPGGWKCLLEAGVDFISTDDLEGLEQFLKSRTMRAEPAESSPSLVQTPEQKQAEAGKAVR